MWTLIKHVFRAVRKNKDSATPSPPARTLPPTIERVEVDHQEFLSKGQGPISNYQFFSPGSFIGTATVELWRQDGLLLIHNIRAERLRRGEGTAILEWLLSQHAFRYVIQPVHIVSGANGFWSRVKDKWPGMVAATDIRSCEYEELREKRAQKENQRRSAGLVIKAIKP